MSVRAWAVLLLAGCGAAQTVTEDAGGDAAGGAAMASAGGTSAGGTASAGGAASAGGGTAGAVDAGLAGCTATFCDDFERYDAGSPPRTPWTTSVQGGSVTIDSTRAHSGAKSVKVTTDGQMPYRRAYFSVGAPFFAGNAFYGRMWVYLAAAPSMTTHWTNISGEGMASFNNQSFAAYVRYGGQVMKRLMANYDSQTFSSDCWQHSQTTFPEARWACMEWHFDGPNERMEFWLDGTQVSALTVNHRGQGCIANGLSGQWVMPNFSTLRLGWEHYQTSIPIQLWVDDVALSTQRVGCR